VRILSDTPGLPPELPGLASLHHERFDGSGYPRGLRGDAIAISGLIAGIVDTFDTLTAPRPFGEHLSPANALSQIYKERGKRFHPALVEQFIQCVGVFPVGSVVELNSGEVAVVIAQNMVRRMQPRIMVVRDASGNPMVPYKMLDLMKEPKCRPDEPYRILRSLEYDTGQDRPARAVPVTDSSAAEASEPTAVDIIQFCGLLRKSLDQRLTDGKPLAVLVIECGVIGRIDAVWGYQVGDAVRQRVSSLLRSEVLRPGDFLTEMGRDEFACLLSTVEGPTVALLAANKSLRTLNAPFWVGEEEIYANPAIGIAIYPEHADKAESLLQRARSACTMARNLPGRIADYDADQDLVAENKLLIENRLRTAVAENTLELVFQPQYDLRLGQVMGAEALLQLAGRQPGPDRDGTGLCRRGNRRSGKRPGVSSILNRALRNISEFRYSGGLDLRIGVRLPGSALRHPELVDVIQRSLGTWSRRPGTLILGISQTSALLADTTARETLVRIKEIGVKLAIDDPTMRIASFFRLVELPFQELRFDVSAAGDPASAPKSERVLKAIIELAHQVRLSVLAIGVTDEAAAARLKALGCDFMQADFKGPAVEPKAFVERYGFSED
jgi:diguanylate cyclase (GGDEF)-like protein